MTFTVYAELAPEVSKKLDRLAKKAAGYAIPFSYAVGEEHPQQVAVREVAPVTQTIQTVSTYTVAAVDFEVECDELIRANGWTVWAKVEHGAMRQVGRTCLKEYTGISPATAAMWAEVQDLVDTGMDCTRDEWEAHRPVPMYEVLGILAHAYDVVKEFGYRKSAEPDSTRERVAERVISGKQPSAEGLERAAQIRDWLLGLDRDEASDLENNCVTLAVGGYAKTWHFGLLAYMPVAYERYLEWKARAEAQRATAARSEYVGEVGQRITLKAATVALLFSWDGYYGTTWLYKFVDESGNVYIWYASRLCTAEDDATIKATVKGHNERQCVKQTIVTRCCMAA